MTLTLYYHPGTCSLAPTIALDEAGADYRLEKADIRGKPPEWLEINPKGSVPALRTDRGVLTENPVILGYVAQTHPEANLAPVDDSYAFGALQSFNMYIASTIHPLFARAFFIPDTDDAKAKARELLVKKLTILHDHLFQGPWVRGESYTIADPYLCVVERWAEKNGLFSDGAFPKLDEHLRRMLARPAVQRAIEKHG